MKMFGWIQCKLGNSNSGLLKDSGSPSCLSLKPSCNNQQDYLRPKNGSKGTMQPQHGFEEYLSQRSMGKAQEEFGEATEETFPGFLTIGTLSVASMALESATPTFGFPPDETTPEDFSEGVNYDLKLINEKLEKCFTEEAENEWLGESKRFSGASTITLSDKEKERLDISKDNDMEAKTFHPLQGYLFASSYDLSASKDEAGKETASVLQEAETILSVHVEKKQDQAIRKYKAPVHHMRRLLHALQPSHKKNAAVRDGTSTESCSPTSSKFQKIKQLFRKKVHPEDLTAVKESKSYSKHKINGNTNICRPSNGGGPTASREHIDEAWEELGQYPYITNLKPSQNPITKTRCTPLQKKSNNTNAEHWIISDADYLVLELGQK